MPLAQNNFGNCAEALSLREAIKVSLGKAEQSGNEVRAATLRLVQCAVRDRDLKARRKDERRCCDDAEITEVLQQMAEQRSVAAAEYDSAGRYDLAEQERDELEVLRDFLPKNLKPTELEEAAEEVVTELDAKGLKDIGRCVSEMKARYPNQVESAAAKAAVKKLLI